MVYDKIKQDHNWAKNGGEGWAYREDAKKAFRKRLRAFMKKSVKRLDQRFWLDDE